MRWERAGGTRVLVSQPQLHGSCLQLTTGCCNLFSILANDRGFGEKLTNDSALKCQTRFTSIHIGPFATPLLGPRHQVQGHPLAKTLQEVLLGALLTCITLLQRVSHHTGAFSLWICLSFPFLWQLSSVTGPPQRTEGWDNWSWPHYGSSPSAGETLSHELKPQLCIMLSKLGCCWGMRGVL